LGNQNENLPKKGFKTAKGNPSSPSGKLELQYELIKGISTKRGPGSSQVIGSSKEQIFFAKELELKKEP